MKTPLESHINLSRVIDGVASGPAGKVSLVESDGVVVALCPDFDRNMVPEKLRLDLTELFIDICMKEVSFDAAIKRIGQACMSARVYVYHIVHSTNFGVLALREEYAA